MPAFRHLRPASARLATVGGLAALAACGTQSDGPGTTATQAAAGGNAGARITVTATDSECTLSATSAPAGAVTFQVTNSGSKVNELYVYGAGDKVVGEVENIAPGVSRSLDVDLTAGTVTVACKPGMAGDGIRVPFTVTG